MKAIVNGGAGTNNFGGITAFTRTWICRGEEDGPDLNKPIIKSKSIPERLPFEGNGREGLIMLRDQLPMFFKGDSDDLPDITPLYLAQHTYEDPRNYVTVTRINNKPFFYSLFIGSDITAVEAECFENFGSVGPVTKFDGNLKDIGSKAFYNYGNDEFNEFSNLTNLIIHSEAFSKSRIGGLYLRKCDVSDAVSAFEDSTEIEEIRLEKCVGNLIPDSFAKNCTPLGEIYLQMDGGAIGDYAFYGLDSTNLTIDYDCTEIGVSAFEKNKFNLITIPSSITLFKERAFADAGVALLKVDGEINATFEKECFMDNAINNVGDILVLGGTFKEKCFYKSTSNSETVIKGSIVGDRAFGGSNRFWSLTILASIASDYAFVGVRAEKPENPLIIKGNITARHTFTSNRSITRNTYQVEDISKISNSFRTFQQEAKVPGTPPVASLGWVPEVVPSNWSDVYDKTCWFRDDAVQNYSSTDWVNDAPAQITVRFGGQTSTMLKTVTQFDDGGSIQEFYYSEYFPGSEAGGYDPDTGSIGYDYYNVVVYYLPWGGHWEDLEESGYPITWGKGGWVAEASSNNYAQVSPVYLQTDNPETIVGDFYDEGGGGNSEFGFKGIANTAVTLNNVSHTNSPEAFENLIPVVRSEAGTKLLVSEGDLETANSNGFRRKHMFYGNVGVIGS
jgi:hypothetical protein